MTMTIASIRPVRSLMGQPAGENEKPRRALDSLPLWAMVKTPDADRGHGSVLKLETLTTGNPK